MELQEQIEIIARYDGYDVVKCMPHAYGGGEPLRPIITYKKAEKYLTDLTALHKVAMKVLADFHSHKDWIENPTIEIVEKLTGITQSCSTSPVNGQYIDLLNAVCDGIEFLNSKKY